MKTLWLLVLTVLGCAPAPYTYVSDCVVIDSEVVLYQNKVDLYVGKAMELFDGKFGNGEFCKAATGTDILVRAEADWIGSGGVPCIGETVFGEISVSVWGNAFVHEMIHVRQLKAGDLGTLQHERWNYLGYYDVARQFGDYINSPAVDYWLTP